MICIVRIQSQGQADAVWQEIVRQKDELQEALDNQGRLLYLSKRCKHNEASLFMHIADTNILGDFIARHLAKIRGVDAIWLINMLKPRFFPLPADARRRSEAESRRTSGMKRYTVTIKAYSPRLDEIYEQIANLPPAPACATADRPGITLGYLAYTFHLFGDSIQISLSGPDEASIKKYAQEVINNIPGVLGTTICEIEKTHPFISYQEWREYTGRLSTLMDWDEQHMVAQFEN
ncbi:MAG: hypothetical protein HY762_05975 [Planctomycetes bacterium]|nr:hypothetical protein [Planctomycetota bacterium]